MAAIPIVNQVQKEPSCSLEKGLVASHLTNPKDATDGRGLSFCITCKHLVCQICRDKEHSDCNIKFSHEASLSLIRAFVEEQKKVKTQQEKLQEYKNMGVIEKLPSGLKALQNAFLKIDDVFLRIRKQIEQSRENLKNEVKMLLSQAIQTKLSEKSNATQEAIAKLEQNLKLANEEFEKMRAKGNHAILCKQWNKLEELYGTVNKVSERVSKFGVIRNKDNFFSPEDIQIGVNLQRLSECVSDIVKNSVSIKILGKTELKWPADHDITSVQFIPEVGNRSAGMAFGDESNIFQNSHMMQSLILPDMDMSTAGIPKQNNRSGDIMRELFTGQTSGTIAAAKPIKK